MAECKTYPAMNDKIKELLRIGSVEEDPVGVYATVRIAELESRLTKLEAAASDAADLLEAECENCNHYTAEHCIAAGGFCSARKVAREIRGALADTREATNV